MLIASLLFALVTGSPSAHATPTDCQCGTQTISVGRVLKEEHQAGGPNTYYGYRVEVMSFFCESGGRTVRCADVGGTPTANECLALVKDLGWYSQDLSGAKVKSGKMKKTGIPIIDQLTQQPPGAMHPRNVCGGKFQFDVAYESNHPVGGAVVASGAGTPAAKSAAIGSRPNPDAAAVQIDTNADPKQTVTAIAVDEGTGEPIVDGDVPLNAELDKQLKATGWSAQAITHGFRPGTIVAARKKLRLQVNKEHKTNNLAASIFMGKKYKEKTVPAKFVDLEDGQLGEVVSTGVSTPGGPPQVYVLWRKKKSNWLPFIRDIISVVVGIQYSPGLAASAITNLLGGWQSYGEIQLVLAPADAVDLEVVR